MQDESPLSWFCDAIRSNKAKKTRQTDLGFHPVNRCAEVAPVFRGNTLYLINKKAAINGGAGVVLWIII